MSQPTQMASDHDIMITHTRMHKHPHKEISKCARCDVFLSKGKDSMSHISGRQSRDSRQTPSQPRLWLLKYLSENMILTATECATEKTSLLDKHSHVDTCQERKEISVNK